MGFEWHDPLSSGVMRLTGFAFVNENHDYVRLPHRAKTVIDAANPDVWRLGTHTSGGQLHFRTTSDVVTIRATLGAFDDVAAMSAVGRGGFDLSAGLSFAEQSFLGATAFDAKTKHIEHAFDLSCFDEAVVTIHFPLYAGVDALHIGLDEDARTEAWEPYGDHKGVAIYGTSITQGAFASRPGLSFVNILSRMQRRPWYNFGFSGNGLGEEAIVDALTDVGPIDAFIIDYEANAGSGGELEATLERIIHQVRAKHPDIDIHVVSRIPYVYDDLDPAKGKRRQELRAFQRDLVNRHRLEGDERVFFADGTSFFGSDAHRWMVDTIHPDDIGHHKIARGIHAHMQTIPTP